MNDLRRFVVGATLGAGALGLYLLEVGVDGVLDRAASVPSWALALLVALVVAEGLADAIGVWASIRPLGDGLGPVQSVQFALAGDFFDIVSPAGAATSEPIMARFIGVTTETSYSEALGVRGVAKYVKAGGQVALSAGLGLAILTGRASAGAVLTTLALAVGTLLVVGASVVGFRRSISRVLVAVLAPVLARVTDLYRAEPLDRAAVQAAVDRFWRRVLAFRSTPGLVALIVLGGVLEQLLVAVALWSLLAASGTAVGFLVVLVVVPLPQAATVVPVPASLGAYDLLMGGALVLAAGVPAPAAAATVLLFRTASIPFGLSAGGLSVAFLRGWRPGVG